MLCLVHILGVSALNSVISECLALSRPAQRRSPPPFLPLPFPRRGKACGAPTTPPRRRRFFRRAPLAVPLQHPRHLPLTTHTPKRKLPCPLTYSPPQFTTRKAMSRARS